MDFNPLITIVVSFATGCFGGYLTHKQIIKRDNISVKRERIVKNVAKAEDYIQLMIEEKFLERDMARVDELIHEIDTNLDFVRKGLAQTQIEVKKVEKDFLNIPDNEYHGELEDQQRSLLSSLKKYELMLDSQSKKREKTAKEIKELSSRIDQINKRLILDDIGATFLSIDPSGKIAGYLTELQSIQKDKTTDFYSNARAIELRSKIYSIFTEIVSKVG